MTQKEKLPVITRKYCPNNITEYYLHGQLFFTSDSRDRHEIQLIKRIREYLGLGLAEAYAVSKNQKVWSDPTKLRRRIK